MNVKTFEKATELRKKIKQLNEALECFEWEDPGEKNKKFSTNPSLIIEFDGDGRERAFLPMQLSDRFTLQMRAEIKEELVRLKIEFNLL